MHPSFKEKGEEMKKIFGYFIAGLPIVLILTTVIIIGGWIGILAILTAIGLAAMLIYGLHLINSE